MTDTDSPGALSPDPTDADLVDLSATELVRRTTAGEVTARQLVEASLARIAERDPALDAFSVVLADAARAEAAERDAARDRGEPCGPLHGVPVAVKEELDVAGCVTTFGGRGNSTPVRADGEVVRRLRAAGAVVVGKTRMPEFGQWPFTESEAGGLTRNPWDPGRTPGGSSGGTAVAVAAGMVPVAIGGDGGGSIRIPSACCGLYGLKPQRGRVTTAPHPHLWWALGTVGPLTRTVADAALVYDVLRGNEPGDLFTAPDPARSFVEAAASTPRRLRIGWSEKPQTPFARVDPAHVRALEETAALLTDLGHDVRRFSPRWPDATLAFVPQFFAGMRAEADEVEHPERLERRTRQAYRLGGWVRPGVVRWAVRAGERLAERADRLFDQDGFDVLLTPTIAERPRAVGALDGVGPLRAAWRAQPMIAHCALWNVTGHPAAAVPAGTGRDGLPLSVQLVGRRHDEDVLLGLSAQLEAARPWAAPDPSRWAGAAGRG
ncbi:amidase [Nocardioides scoriae]|uniref:Amidase n=1 Tax=Nocardioides scoriae TaxID=642780 RepID=A0A1H1QSJ6_9ACTN|nr:amidase [Nocardioides scoriae]SDS26317.1 amidase [Nocardioides scoriae]